MSVSFSNPDTWRGGFYELAMEYAPPGDALLQTALQALWSVPELEGCYLLPEVEPESQARVAPTLAALEAAHLRGVATLPNGRRVACGTYLVREDGGAAWLGFYIPMGALGGAYDVGAYPFGPGPSSQAWREPLDNWLAGIGQVVFAQAPFSLGLVGFEVSGNADAHELSVAGVPAQRWGGYLVPADGKLTWYPANQWQPQPLAAS